MKLTVIVEGQGLDLEPLADILESVALEKERLLSAWLDIPLEMVPNKVHAEISDTEMLITESVTKAVRSMALLNPLHRPIVDYIRNKIIAFKMPLECLVGLQFEDNIIKLTFEMNHG